MRAKTNGRNGEGWERERERERVHGNILQFSKTSSATHLYWIKVTHALQIGDEAGGDKRGE